MGSSTMFKCFMLMAVFTTSCIAQPPTATPTVSPTASPTPAPVVTPPSPSPAPAPGVPSPSPTAVPSPAPSPDTDTQSSSPSPGPSTTGPPADVPPSGTFVDGWVNRAVIVGTAVAGSFLAVTLM
ncbi:hypothetical protein L6452_09972 [Arctium lappa]|uniref:Uncharacterized protein n=1 Tax=Arctium lappa TaxID=4217 RepID=A0ACB9DME2_ARCLA|nr:hypothetical protein L6452_09972 [Arctium lappa]